jgi:hypothetical protein
MPETMRRPWSIRGLGFAVSLGFMRMNTPGTQGIDFPDRLGRGAGAERWLNYVGGLGGGAAIRYQGDYAVVLLGFPFEALDDPADRTRVMQSVLTSLGM